MKSYKNLISINGAPGRPPVYEPLFIHTYVFVAQLSVRFVIGHHKCNLKSGVELIPTEEAIETIFF